MDVELDEIDVCPLQIQGPKSLALMADLVGDRVREIPYYGLLEANIAGCSVVVSQSGFSGEKGYEIYLRDATQHAEGLWHAVLEAGKTHQLMVIAPGHQRRIRMRAEIEAGRPPFSMVMVGMKMGGRPIDDYAPDFWLVSDADSGEPIGYLTSPWHAPELGCNISLGYVPVGMSAVEVANSRGEDATI